MNSEVENLMEWAETMSCACTVCDANLDIIFMNVRSRETFARHGDLIGKNLMDLHPEHARATIRRMMETDTTNAYTISKGGLKKLIFQTPWHKAGKVAGLVELSMVIPEDMPHYDRR